MSREPATMDALQIAGPKQLLQTRLPIPELAPGEILIKSAYVGICGTDVHLWEGNSFYYDQGYAKYPFVFGHEYTGYVAEPNGARGLTRGDRVVGHCLVECHVCDTCKKGRRHHCRNLREVGLRYMAGAAAEYIAVPAYAVSKVPDGLSLLAATLVEPTVTAYHAVERANIRADDTVAIIGSGALGLLSLLIAKLYARRVDVIGVVEGELNFAKSLGASNVLKPDQAKDNQYSVVLESSGSQASAALTARLLDMGGRCSIIGVCNEAARNYKPSFVTLKDLTLHGILHGLDYYQQTLDLFASRRVDPTPLIAEVGAIADADSMFCKLISPDRVKPKYIFEFAGEKH